MTAESELVDEYIASFPAEVQPVLQEVRRAIHEAIPGASEKISYQIPAVTLEGRPVVYFAGWKKHVSLYPVPELDGAIAARVGRYLSGKGTAKFPLDEPIPLDLVSEIAQRLAERH